MTSIPATFFTKDGQRLSKLAYAFLLLLCIAFFTPGIATLPPTDRDESSFAQASKQMIETGNYVDIRLQDKPRYKKPIGIYWLQSASVRLLNVDHLNEIWAYRIPSLLGATVAVLMTAALGTLLFGPMTGLLAAMMMAGCVILNAEARLAKTDAALLGSIMVMQFTLARAYMGIRSWRNSLIFWLALGVGILIKGPIPLLILFSTLLYLRFAEKHAKWFRNLKPLPGLILLALIVVPWFVAIMLQSHGSFATQSAGQDLFSKLWQGQNRGIMPPGMHLLALPIVFFPFALFATLAIPDSWKDRHQKGVGFCIGWILPTWIVFEISLTKLPHYTLPVYPAIALLSARALLAGYPALNEKKASRWVWASVVALWLTIGTGFAIIFAGLPMISDNKWSIAQIIAGAVLILSQGAALYLIFKRKTDSVIVLSFGSLVFMGCVFGLTLPSLDHLWLSRQAVQMAQSIKPCDHLEMVSASYGEPSLVFMAGTDTQIVSNGELAAASMIDDNCRIGLIDDKKKDDFLAGFHAARAEPLALGKVEGINIGHGKSAAMTLYVMPPKINAP
ncbi:MAG TPA: glycosyltransferase family 39 protein [Alphaproteobacteria bacterium]|nr:glycosyltransferase family 39 protein [Alphaproteobacteria bacterium]